MSLAEKEKKSLLNGQLLYLNDSYGASTMCITFSHILITFYSGGRPMFDIKINTTRE